MMSVEELHPLCQDLRAKRVQTDEELISKIESEVAQYRAYMDERAELPPDELRDRLWYMGWLLYEATWHPLEQIAPAYESLSGALRETSQAVQDLIARAADAARALPWPEFAPRALGAIRAEALAASKRDTEDGYHDAWILHEEARTKYQLYRNYHVDKEDRKHLVLALDEALLQLALAETGTACRTAERVIGRWAEEFEFSRREDERWAERMFPELYQGVTIGEQALGIAEQIEKEHGFIEKPDEKRLAMRTSFRNPGIMTARAALLMLAMCPEMESLGRRPLPGHDSWEQSRESLLKRFEFAYHCIERDVRDDQDQPLPLLEAHARSLIQLRLNLALLVPGHALPSKLAFDPCLKLNPLDDNSVKALSGWLAESVNGKQRGDANVIGSATKPGFIRSVEACRATAGAGGDGYVRWRRRWPTLDRYASEPGRSGRVEEALTIAQEG
jgi:hypothetical protein